MTDDRGPVYGGWECGKFGAGEHGEKECGVTGCQAVVTLLAYTALRGEVERLEGVLDGLTELHATLQATHDKLRAGVLALCPCRQGDSDSCVDDGQFCDCDRGNSKNCNWLGHALLRDGGS